jgi:small subunit ribosomal protein S8
MKNLLWNMFANIKNGQLSKRNSITQKKKKICEKFLKVLWNEGFIAGYVIDKKNPSQFRIFLKYRNNKPVINLLKVISKPSRRISYSVKQLWKIKSNKSLIIISTNQGLKPLTECKKLGIGGEPFIIIN